MKNKPLKKIRFTAANPPLYNIDFCRLNDMRLKMGISLRTMKLCLAEKYHVYLCRSALNNFFGLRRDAASCKASVFIAIADILGVSMNDFILKDNQTQARKVIHNNQNAKKSPVEGIKTTTKRDVKDRVEYKSGTVGSGFVRGCVF